MRKLRTLFTLLVVSICAVQSAWAQEELAVTVSLAEPGGLATEIRAYPGVEHEKYVTSLTVTSGTLNDDDWATLKLMDALVTLDLSGTSNKSIPDNQFKGCCENLVSIAMPSQLETIGAYAFYASKYNRELVTAIIPATVTSIGENAFGYCRKLESIGNWPSGCTTIPSRCFMQCEKLPPFDIPEGVTFIDGNAFDHCYLFKSTIPTTITSIGYRAFYHCGMENIDIVIPEGTSVGNEAFYSSGIKSIEFPATITYLPLGIASYCKQLKELTLKSPTVSVPHANESISGTNITTIHVPSYLVDAYKSNSFWYNYSFVGFDITQYDIWWPIRTSLNLNGYTRMAGTPKVSVCNSVNLTISGDAAQQFGEFSLDGHTSYNSSSSNYHNNNWAQILSTCDNVAVTGNYYHKVQTYQKQWYFMCLPFDLDVSSITTDNRVKFAIRYYDGASRAANNASTGNWKNYANDAVIPAGTGFIYQTSETTWSTFKAVANASRSNAFKNEEFVKALDKNDTPNEGITLAPANKGWNLVGNPWQCYFNIHKLNYTAPISVRQGNNYVAYSLVDDDYAIEPNQAFFVQCPDELSSIGFPTDGRQLTADITSVQGARQLTAGKKTRWLVDVQIANGEENDKTRLVVNNSASMDYEMTCDASKFMSWDGTVPQIYSFDADETQYAINERPLDNGTLRLGIVIKEAGQYSMTAIRNDIGQVLLTDHETGITTDLSQNGYSFNAEAGTFDARFTISFMSDEVTGIKTIDNTTMTDNRYFNLSGQRVDQPKKGIYVVNGKKTIVK